MPNTSAGLPYPAGSAAPDVAGDIYNLANLTDQYLRVGGAEYCSNLGAIQNIPSARTYKGKLAYSADADLIYRYNGSAWVVYTGDGTGYLSLAGTITNIGGDRYCTCIRSGPTVTLNVGVFTGSNGLSAGGVVMGLPTGWRPKPAARHIQLFAFSNSDGTQNGTIRLRAEGITNSAALVFESYVDGGGTKGTSFGGNFRIEGTISYPGE